MNARTYNKLKTELHNLVSNLSYMDFCSVNKLPNGELRKPSVPYRLSSETEVALNFFKLIQSKRPDEINPQEEEMLKGYVKSIRLKNRHLLRPVQENVKAGLF